MFYAATSWDENGKSPTQNEIEQGINHLKSYPGPRGCNLAIWQPHLENENLIHEIWQWIQHFCNVTIDFQSMPLAKNQIWWLIVPEEYSTENTEVFHHYDIFFKRNDIKNQILDNNYFYKEENRQLSNYYTRTALAKVYMQVHCLMDYMYNTYSYYPVTLNKQMYYPVEFNLEFGKYFNNVPVLPTVMASFYDSPKLVKHHDEKRGFDEKSSHALRKWKFYETSHDMRFVYWWNKNTQTLGEKLTKDEVNQNYKKLDITKSFVDDKNLLNFNDTDYIF